MNMFPWLVLILCTSHACSLIFIASRVTVILINLVIVEQATWINQVVMTITN